jgi:hypothetical protein
MNLCPWGESPLSTLKLMSGIPKIPVRGVFDFYGLLITL